MGISCLSFSDNLFSFVNASMASLRAEVSYGGQTMYLGRKKREERKEKKKQEGRTKGIDTCFNELDFVVWCFLAILHEGVIKRVHEPVDLLVYLCYIFNDPKI